jgi:hypothetical protein
MDYFVKSGEQRLGPFSLAQLQEQVQSGKVSMGDLAQSEGMADWAPVSQVIGNIPVPVTPYGAAAAPALEPVQTVDLPPNLHWVIVLLMNIASRLWIGFLLFNFAWTFVLANWARKLNGNVNTLVLVAMYPGGIIAGVLAIVINPESGDAIAGFLILGGVIAYIVGIFKIRAAMEEYYNSTENIGLTLSGAMTFFFSTVYLQYHVNRIAKWKRTGELS